MIPLSRTGLASVVLGLCLAQPATQAAAQQGQTYTAREDRFFEIAGRTANLAVIENYSSSKGKNRTFELFDCPAGLGVADTDVQGGAFLEVHKSYAQFLEITQRSDVVEPLRQKGVEIGAVEKVYVSTALGWQYVVLSGDYLLRVDTPFEDTNNVYVHHVVDHAPMSQSCVQGGVLLDAQFAGPTNGNPAGGGNTGSGPDADCDPAALARPGGIGDRFDLDDADRLKRKADCSFSPEELAETYLMLCAYGIACIGEDRMPAEAIVRGAVDEAEALRRLLELDGYASPAVMPNASKASEVMSFELDVEAVWQVDTGVTPHHISQDIPMNPSLRTVFADCGPGKAYPAKDGDFTRLGMSYQDALASLGWPDVVADIGGQVPAPANGRIWHRKSLSDELAYEAGNQLVMVFPVYTGSTYSVWVADMIAPQALPGACGNGGAETTDGLENPDVANVTPMPGDYPDFSRIGLLTCAAELACPGTGIDPAKLRRLLKIESPQNARALLDALR